MVIGDAPIRSVPKFGKALSIQITKLSHLMTPLTPVRRVPYLLLPEQGNVPGEWKKAIRGGLRNLDRCDKWSFCLTAAKMAAELERR
jgi:hypothetical protein